MQVPADNHRLIPHEIIDRLESEWRQVRAEGRAEIYSPAAPQPAQRQEIYPQNERQN